MINDKTVASIFQQSFFYHEKTRLCRKDCRVIFEAFVSHGSCTEEENVTG